MNWFERHVATRWFDYGWAYRLRLARLRGLHDPLALQSGTKRPILLLPGVYETWHFLESVGGFLNGLGHPVHVVPTFGHNLRPIPEMAALARDYLEAAGLSDVAIVAHSKGGLIGKTVMLSDTGMSRVASMVAINSPFGGSDYAHLVPIRTLREFVPSHETIRALAENAEVNSRITSVFSEWDPIIPNGSVLEGARNIELPSRGHFLILDRPDLFATVAEAVSRE
ncbi:MAG: alpha/beta hydrolase [Glaciihabitans sp.]|jgi:triacylglycerol lipase|nr:alpha/beta hydrolase [Glaciihabitans sp.]